MAVKNIYWNGTNVFRNSGDTAPFHAEDSDLEACCCEFNGFWCRADIAASVLEGISPDDPAENNDPVRRWKDQLTGLGVDDGNQATLNNRPIYLTGKPELDFDGDDAGDKDYIDAGAVGNGPGTVNVGIVAVIKRDVVKANTIVDKRAGGADGVLFGAYTDDKLYLYIEDVSANWAQAGSPGTIGGNYITLAGFVDRINDRLKIYINSTTPAANVDCSGVTGSLGNSAAAYVGRESPIPGTGWRGLNGKICEVYWAYAGSLVEADVQSLITAMKTRWST